MAYIGVRNSVALSVGDISATIAPYDLGTQTEDYQAVGEGTYNVAAGKYRVMVYNSGVYDITVNGDNVPTGEIWLRDAIANPATQVFDLTPAVEIIVPAGGNASYSTISPST